MTGVALDLRDVEAEILGQAAVLDHRVSHDLFRQPEDDFHHKPHHSKGAVAALEEMAQGLIGSKARLVWLLPRGVGIHLGLCL